jgi:hypothetical protein
MIKSGTRFSNTFILRNSLTFILFIANLNELFKLLTLHVGAISALRSIYTTLK